MSFDALSQLNTIQKQLCEIQTGLSDLKAQIMLKEQRKATITLRKQYKVKQEDEVSSIEPAVPEVVVAQPVAAESPLQMQSEFKELPMQAPGAPVKKARKPLTQEHIAAMQAGRQKKKAEKKAREKEREREKKEKAIR